MVTEVPVSGLGRHICGGNLITRGRRRVVIPGFEIETLALGKRLKAEKKQLPRWRRLRLSHRRQPRRSVGPGLRLRVPHA